MASPGKVPEQRRSQRSAFIFTSGSRHARLPAASIKISCYRPAHEHAARLRRLLEAGPLRAHLTIDSKVVPMTARNIVAEIPGSDPAEGWILAGGHYDGHDIAQAAQDNAAGTAVLLEAARLLSPLRAHLKAGIASSFG
jgi:hypothetical protein